MRISLVLGIVSAVVGILFALVFTLNPVFHVANSNRIFDKDTGTLYGTILGGVLGPLFSLTSFLLVYASFREQQNFNRNQEKYNRDQVKYARKQIFRDQYFELINHFHTSVYAIQYRKAGSKRGIQLSGTQFFVDAKRQVEALIDLVKDELPKNDDPVTLMSVAFSIF